MLPVHVASMNESGWKVCTKCPTLKFFAMQDGQMGRGTLPARQMNTTHDVDPSLLTYLKLNQATSIHSYTQLKVILYKLDRKPS